MKSIEEQASFTQNLAWWEHVQDIIPNGCSTLAKTPERLFPGHMPVCCAEALNARFIDIDGNQWLDCEMAMGTAVWGHARKEIQSAAIQQLSKGTSFSIPSDIELTCGELILERFEGKYSALRFCKSGADAVSGAVRLARAYSHKPIVIATAYHGWHDWSAYGYYGQQADALGIPPEIEKSTVWIGEPTVDRITEVVHQHADKAACIVLCPNEWERDTLFEVVNVCRSNGILVIFDEVTSGIRMGKKATAGEFDIWPDLLCISKGMANGFPLGAVLGNEDLMNLCGQVKFSNAHSSETIALAAAIACEQLMKSAPVWPSWRGATEEVMSELQDELVALNLTGVLALKGTYASFCIRSTAERDFYRDPFREFMVKELASHGIFSKGFFIFSDSHTRIEIMWVKETLKQILRAWPRYQ
ncbi:aminotransferase class III-fold pyridoxal phosphate-dependent enzyme [Paenibacillus sp. 5J-6]|uniref:Aminotransferase class III-fold pyridoxal phosphate-dependent enzyme n=1 Tax=Paenibacillus silvestris TaxID=2606219 RepID=A0A6L8UXX4_9BACL|nr:aminotransferase class III-fold pyridoxal phosphate-dependent enzyme [Paenibacillus silvestris]MZQ82131.1 aminotransferase class III-fold pyridoxal phosphate-dependent enzyme [Paenibacillus silvestris]